MTAPLDTSTLSTNPIFAMAERAEALRASGVDVIVAGEGVGGFGRDQGTQRGISCSGAVVVCRGGAWCRRSPVCRWC
jgi:hypothetical protein